MTKLRLIVLTFFTILTLTSLTFAQLEIKPAIGINFTGFSQDPENATTSAQVGWQLGATVSAGDKFYGEGGIFWVHKSNKITENTTDVDFDTKLAGIRIPLMVGYHLLGKEKDVLGLRAFGGGSVFFLSSVTAEGLSLDDFNSAHYGVFLGLGADLSLFFIDVKYEWSLTDVTSIKTIDLGQARSLFVNAGIRISI